MTSTTEMISGGSAAGLFPAVAIPAADINRVVTLVIAAGNATSLFPVITPAAGAPPSGTIPSTRTEAGNMAGLPPGVSPTAMPSPAPQTGPRTTQPGSGAAADASATSPGWPVLVAGLIVAALAVMLAMTRLFARRRAGARGRRA